MNVAARRQGVATDDQEVPSHRFKARMVGGADGEQVRLGERKVGPLHARQDVMDMGDGRTVAAEQAADRAAFTVALQYARAEGAPGG